MVNKTSKLISLSFSFPVCVNITYLVHDYGMSFTVTVNKHTIFNETVSGKYIFWCVCVFSENLQLLVVTMCFPWHSSVYFLINLLTPCSEVLLEKLTGLQLVTKFPTFYGTRRFITAFTSSRHLSLSLASSIQSLPHPIPLPNDPS